MGQSCTQKSCFEHCSVAVCSPTIIFPLPQAIRTNIFCCWTHMVFLVRLPIASTRCRYHQHSLSPVLSVCSSSDIFSSSSRLVKALDVQTDVVNECMIIWMMNLSLPSGAHRHVNIIFWPAQPEARRHLSFHLSTDTWRPFPDPNHSHQSRIIVALMGSEFVLCLESCCGS